MSQLIHTALPKSASSKCCDSPRPGPHHTMCGVPSQRYCWSRADTAAAHELLVSSRTHTMHRYGVQQMSSVVHSASIADLRSERVQCAIFRWLAWAQPAAPRRRPHGPCTTPALTTRSTGRRCRLLAASLLSSSCFRLNVIPVVTASILPIRDRITSHWCKQAAISALHTSARGCFEH